MSEYIKRSHSRNLRETSILILTEKDYASYRKEQHYYTPAQMLNSDKGGMYFETDYPIQPGQNISIKVIPESADANKHHDAYTVHYARVKWCRQVSEDNDTRYGMGAQILDTVIQAVIH